jgi:hypothetical protein
MDENDNNKRERLSIFCNDLKATPSAGDSNKEAAYLELIASDEYSYILSIDTHCIVQS